MIGIKNDKHKEHDDFDLEENNVVCYNEVEGIKVIS